ncbi:Peptidase M23B [Candidatus Sulfopaludibacter sp. SbA4]|nr:Peptidase M23B [Candidatus Sulfopaludibacter sp. SbA4]
MRARIVGAFALGVATGFLCLGVVLWRMGAIQPTPAIEALLPGWKRPMTPMPFDLNQLTAEAKNIPPPRVEAPPPLPSAGEADRTAPSPSPSLPRSLPAPPRLGMPIAGIDARTLADTFADKRDGRKHEALDIPSPRGTRVLAVAEGNVAKLFTSKEGGLTVYQFDNTQTWCYYYAHLDRYAPGLVEGTLLRKGEVLGYVGSTGNASPAAPHLHFAVFQLKPDKKWWDGTPIDPLPLLR